MDIRVAQFVNSFVDRPGNIGVRVGRILKETNSSIVCFCRGTESRLEGITYIEMGVLGHLSRLLNAVRIYFLPWFKHRLIDITIFQLFVLHYLPTALESHPVSVAHLWDTCPRLINKLKKEGVFVVLDVPVAPSGYCQRVYKKGKTDFLHVDPRIRELELYCYSTVDRIISPSVFVAQELVREGVPINKVEVIEFGVDVPKRFKKKTLNKKGIDFCFIGNVNKRKGVLELLSAWSHPSFANDRLHLCGRVFPEVKSAIEKNCYGEIYTPGFINPFEYLELCDVFVLPSWLEGSSKAVYEAMACSLPAIVTYASGSIVRDGVEGFLINAGDINGLRDHMLWFKENPCNIQVMGNAARKRALAFSWSRYAKRVNQVYTRLVSNNVETPNKPIRSSHNH